MEITNTEQLADYLHKEKIAFGALTQLSGGSANFVWRMVDGSKPGQSVIIKHAEPYVAASGWRMAFPVDRMDFEDLILARITSILSHSAIVATPKVYSYDANNRVLMLEDGGLLTVKDAYAEPMLNIPHVGEELGQWLAALHHKTTALDIGDNKTAKAVYRFSYSNLATALSKYGLDPSIGERVDEYYGSLLSRDDECVCHGDFWPGNVLVDGQRLMVVDWEIVRRGCGATDVGQFAAEAWLLDRFRGGKGLLSAFLSGYCANTKQDEVSSSHEAVKSRKKFFFRAAIHMGTHLAFWPTRVSWGTEEETAEVVKQGFEMLVRALAGDVEWFGRSCLKEML